VRVVVPLKTVPDLVEEIEFTPDGTGIDTEYLTFVLSEWDDQALEEALLVKEATGGQVVAVGLDGDPEIDQVLYTAIAKGADAAVRIAGQARSARSRSALLAAYLEQNPADLIVTGVQAADDLDGQLAPMLAARLGLPHAGVVIGIEPGDGSVTVRQEFAGGRSHELELPLPAVIGVQAARQSPRYAPISKIRQVTQAGGIEDAAVPSGDAGEGPVVRRMYAPERASHAQMLDGGADAVAEQIIELLAARGLVKG
jgi:electron transfer flavoprotein beta subunit